MPISSVNDSPNALSLYYIDSCSVDEERGFVMTRAPFSYVKKAVFSFFTRLNYANLYIVSTPSTALMHCFIFCAILAFPHLIMNIGIVLYHYLLTPDKTAYTSVCRKTSVLKILDYLLLKVVRYCENTIDLLFLAISYMYTLGVIIGKVVGKEFQMGQMLLLALPWMYMPIHALIERHYSNATMLSRTIFLVVVVCNFARCYIDHIRRIHPVKIVGLTICIAVAHFNLLIITYSLF